MYKCENNKGFTLLELIISLAIIGIILLGFFRVINSTHRISTKNDRDIKALNILQSEIENLRSQIKQSPNEDGERVLVVKDDVSNSEIEIEFEDDINEVKVPEYFKIDEDTNAIYEINDLRIQRKLIIGNNHSINKAFNNYEYIINIKGVLKDKYFSKKTTEINDVRILSNGIIKGGSVNPDPPPDPDPPNYGKGVSFFRIRTQSIIFGKDRSDEWETRVLHNGVSPVKSHRIGFKIKMDRNSETFYIYSTLNGVEKELKEYGYNPTKYDISSIKIDPNSTGGMNSFKIENLVIENRIDNKLVNMYSVESILGEDYVEDRDTYEYVLSDINDSNEKIVTVEFDYYYEDNNATIDFLFGKKGEK